MKIYDIFLATGQTFRVKGMMLQRDEETGQTTIYSTNNPTYIYIVAIIPSTAAIKFSCTEETSAEISGIPSIEIKLKDKTYDPT